MKTISYLPFKVQLLGTKCVFDHHDLQLFGLGTNIGIFHPLEAVGRGSETQHVGDNFYLI